MNAGLYRNLNNAVNGYQITYDGDNGGTFTAPEGSRIAAGTTIERGNGVVYTAVDAGDGKLRWQMTNSGQMSEDDIIQLYRDRGLNAQADALEEVRRDGGSFHIENGSIVT